LAYSTNSSSSCKWGSCKCVYAHAYTYICGMRSRIARPLLRLAGGAACIYVCVCTYMHTYIGNTVAYLPTLPRTLRLAYTCVHIRIHVWNMGCIIYGMRVSYSTNSSLSCRWNLHIDIHYI
jgi:hypothetical protein